MEILKTNKYIITLDGGWVEIKNNKTQIIEFYGNTTAKNASDALNMYIKQTNKGRL